MKIPAWLDELVVVRRRMKEHWWRIFVKRSGKNHLLNINKTRETRLDFTRKMGASWPMSVLGQDIDVQVCKYLGMNKRQRFSF